MNAASQRDARINISTIVFIFWIGFGIYLYFSDRSVFYGLPLAFLSNPLECLWNLVFTFICSMAIIRIWIKPIWYLVFQDTQKIGQKLEWYSQIYQHLKPENRSFFWIRLGIIFGLSGVCFHISSIFDISWLRFQYLLADDLGTRIIKDYYLQSNWFKLESFAIFSSFFYFFLLFEGRSRIVLRFLQRYESRKLKQKFLDPLPPIPYDHKSKELNITMFTSFISLDQPSIINGKNKFSLKQTNSEHWFPLKEKGLRTNSLVIAPSGGGKTVAMVKNVLQQTIFWHYDDPYKKASLIVYDPKAELTSVVREAALSARRKDDLIIFSLSQANCLNPIKIDNPWSGETSWKVAGWIVGAWQNYQGKSSPDPYWESQNYILTRNILVLEYFYKGSYVTIYDVATALNASGDGCFRKSVDDRFITVMGERTLSVFAALEPEQYLKTYGNYKFDHIDFNKIDQHIRARTSERKMGEIGSYAMMRENHHLETDKEIENYRTIIDGPSNKLSIEAQEKLDKRLGKLINADLILKYGNNFEPSEEDFMHTVLLVEGERLLEELKQTNSNYEHIIEIVQGACKWLMQSWSSNASENRGSIVSNMMPFLQQFQTPELKRIFSPLPSQETTDFDDAVNNGMIIVPDFAGIKVGNGIANGIITLVKSRWQHAVLMSENTSRLKIQIMDEAQRIMTIGDGNTNVGDFDYCELSRSFGGITWFLSQSVAALKAKANRDVEWEKIHGVVRSIYCLSTNDGATIKFMQDIAGETEARRVSKTVSETANAPGMDMIAEKYRGEQGTLGISYSVSATLEKKIQAEDIQDADAYSALATVYDGRKNHLMRIALRPSFWPEKRDSYELMQKCDFDPKNRSKFTNRRYPDPFREIVKPILPVVIQDKETIFWSDNRKKVKREPIRVHTAKPLELASGNKLGDSNEA